MAKHRQDRLKPGDRVEWNTSQGKTRGRVKKKLTSATHLKGHKVAASSKNPEYLVESEKSGKKAAHKGLSIKNTAGAKVARKRRSSHPFNLC